MAGYCNNDDRLGWGAELRERIMKMCGHVHHHGTLDLLLMSTGLTAAVTEVVIN